MPATALSKTTSPVAVLRDPKGIDIRALIYHAACHNRPGYHIDMFVSAMMPVIKRPQLFAIDGRPC